MHVDCIRMRAISMGRILAHKIKFAIRDPSDLFYCNVILRRVTHSVFSQFPVLGQTDVSTAVTNSKMFYEPQNLHKSGSWTTYPNSQINSGTRSRALEKFSKFTRQLSALPGFVSTWVNMHCHICRSLYIVKQLRVLVQCVWRGALPCSLHHNEFVNGALSAMQEVFIHYPCHAVALVQYSVKALTFSALSRNCGKILRKYAPLLVNGDTMQKSRRRDRILGRKLLLLLSEIFYLASFYILSVFKILSEDYFSFLFFWWVDYQIKEVRIQNMSDFPLTDRILGALTYTVSALPLPLICT